MAFAWQGPDGERLLVAVNYAPTTRASATSGSLSRISAAGRGGLQDRLGKATYDRDGDSLRSQGLFVDLARWNYHIFDIKLLP